MNPNNKKYYRVYNEIKVCNEIYTGWRRSYVISKSKNIEIERSKLIKMLYKHNVSAVISLKLITMCDLLFDNIVTPTSNRKYP